MEPRQGRSPAKPADTYSSSMKTVVSLPDDLYDEGKSRSQLYQEAVREYVYRHTPEAITEAMNRVCDELDSRPGWRRV